MANTADAPSSLTVIVSAPIDEAELAADVLWQLGAAAVEEIDEGSGTVGLRAALGEDRSLLASALEAVRWPWRFEEVDLAVTDTWRRHVGVIVVDDDLRVVPAWIEVPSDPGVGQELRIEPGPTFGMGSHATTKLCLRALRGEVRLGDTVLDVGTGSGVLSIAAVRFGAERAHGVDLNPACLDVVMANAERNGVTDRVSVSLDRLDRIEQQFDIVVANILAPVLRDLSVDLVRLARRRLVLSGVLAERSHEILDAMKPFRTVSELEEDGWAAIVLER